jgi:hypothetical protein
MPFRDVVSGCLRSDFPHSSILCSASTGCQTNGLRY